MNKRIYYLDGLRVFAIFCVIVLHTAASQWYSKPLTGFNWNVLNIYDSAVRFCVPVMIMISGVIFLDQKKPLSILTLYGKYIFRIITAYLFWSTAYAIFVMIGDVNTLDMHTIKELISRIVTGHYHLWFCYMIVGLYMITPILKKVVEHDGMTKYFLLLSYISAILLPTLQLIPGITNTTKFLDGFKVYLGLGYSFYYVLGYYLNRTKITNKVFYIACAAGVGSTLFTIFITRYCSIQSNTPIQTFYGNLTVAISLQSIAVFLLFKNIFSSVVKNEKMLSYLIQLSNLSFGIYLVHDFFIMILSRIGFTAICFNSLFAVPLLSILVYILSLLTSIFLHKIPIINKYIT